MMHDGPSLPVTHHYYHGQLSSVHLVTATPLIFRFPDESKCNSPLRLRLSTQAGLVACGQAVLAKLTRAYDHGSHTPPPHIHHAHTCRRDLDPCDDELPAAHRPLATCSAALRSSVGRASLCLF